MVEDSCSAVETAGMRRLPSSSLVGNLRVWSHGPSLLWHLPHFFGNETPSRAFSHSGPTSTRGCTIHHPDVDFRKNKLTVHSGAFKGLNTMLFVRTGRHFETTGSTRPVGAGVAVCLCGHGAELGSSSAKAIARSFAPVA